MPNSSSTSQTTVNQPEVQELPGLHRHLLWLVLQYPLQVFFVLWFRYRATGQEGIPKESGALLLSNHQSFLDPAIIGLPLKRPVSYLARDSLFKIPGLGWLMREMKVMSINRKAAGTESLRLSLGRMKQGFLVGIFPEGTRTRDGSLGDIKPGFIALARRSKLPIIPVGISGAYRAMPRGSFIIFPAKISIHYGAPLNPEKVQELTQRGRESEFVEYVSSQIEQAMQQAAR